MSDERQQSHLTRPEAALRNGASETRLRLRINEEGIFTSQRDRDIALSVLARLEDRLAQGAIDRQRYENALGSLILLVPKRDERGRRVIADKMISNFFERVIGSRLSSEAIDITAKNGSWGTLPEGVRDEIACHHGMQIEMTSNCTVYCSFCSFANKGPIKKKVAFDALTKITDYFMEKTASESGVIHEDNFYWGTDPFDVKWLVEGKELDYSDLVEYYRSVSRNRNRFLFTSTAIPIGEEMRILQFGIQLIEARKKHATSQLERLRISVTNNNVVRAGFIRDILEALCPDAMKFIEITGNRHNAIARRGKAWEGTIDSVSNRDVIGPNCLDGTIISPDSVDALIMLAASNEVPTGESRFPVAQEKNGQITYTIPFPQHQPNFTTSNPEEVYTDPWLSKIVMRPEGPLITFERMKGNPHRAFLRMVGILEVISAKRGIADYSELTEADKEQFRELVKEEAAIVQRHLDSGAANKAMLMFMTYFRENNFHS